MERHKAGHLPLDRGELPIATATFARYFIGKVLVGELPRRRRQRSVLVETETYIGGDAAGNAYRGLTHGEIARCFSNVGMLTFISEYGSSYMLNVSSETSRDRSRCPDQGP